MPFFYVDWYYIVLVLPAVILSLWASAHVKSTFRRYSQVRNARGMALVPKFPHWKKCWTCAKVRSS